MILTARAAAAAGLAALAFLPSVLAGPHPNPLAAMDNGIFGRQDALVCSTGGTNCGFYKQLCCYGADQCMTINNQATCTSTAPVGGVTITSVWVQTMTSVFVVPTGNSCGPSQQMCGGQCCGVGMYCGTSQKCLLLPAGSSGGIIATGSPTATVPFQTPIPTGAAGIPIEQTGGGGGLSGGAIAGIVIGVLLGVFLLFLLCIFCCFRALFNTIMACFGAGKKKKHTHEETYIEEHHHSSGGAAAGGRRWYGQGPARPPKSKKSSGGGFGNALGIGALLGGAALALGLKRKHDRKHDEKSTTVSGSSAYYSDDYTSSSSASSSDRHTRHTRHSSRR